MNLRSFYCEKYYKGERHSVICTIGLESKARGLKSSLDGETVCYFMASGKQAGGESQGHVNITIKDPQGEETYFRVKRSTRMRKLFQAFCKRSNIDPSTMRFFFSGERINEDQTPEDLGLHDGDKIDAFVRQVAGCSARSRC
jgi:small ubiquitin-related modifier